MYLHRAFFSSQQRNIHAGLLWLWIIFDGRMDIVHKYSSPEGLQRDGKAEDSPWGFMIQVCVMCPLNKAFHPEGKKNPKCSQNICTKAIHNFLSCISFFSSEQVSYLSLPSSVKPPPLFCIPVAKKSKVPSSYLHWPRNTAHCFLELDLSLAMEYQTWQIHHLFTISDWALVIGVKKSGEAVESVVLPLDWERAVAPSSSINKCGLLLLF